MLPKAIVYPFALVCKALAAFSLHQALALATVIDYDHSKVGVDLSFAIPITAGCANFHFSGDNQFWAHHQSLARFNSGKSVPLSNGSIQCFISSIAIIAF